MAGHGPPPKDPSQRQRRNKTATRSVVEASVTEVVTAAPAAAEGAHVSRALPVRVCTFCPPPADAPPQPKKRGRPRKGAVPPPPAGAACMACGGTGIFRWHPRTQAWWATVWNPKKNLFHDQYLETDVIGGIEDIADMRDAYYRAKDQGVTDLELLREIRLRERDFILSPIARRTAQWEVKRPPTPRPQLVPPLAATGTAGPAPREDPRKKVLHMEGAGGTRA